MNQLEKQVLRIIGENVSAPDAFSDISPVRDSINDAIQEINAVTGGYKESYHVPLVAESTFYRLDFIQGELGWVTDVWDVNRQIRLSQTDLFQLNTHDPRWMIHSGTPDTYFQVGVNVLGIYPKPSATSSMLDVTCVVIPAAYENEDDRIKLRDSFRFACVNFAVSEYFAGRGDAKAAEDHYALYLEAMGGRLRHPVFADVNRQFQTVKAQSSNLGEATP